MYLWLKEKQQLSLEPFDCSHLRKEFSVFFIRFYSKNADIGSRLVFSRHKHITSINLYASFYRPFFPIGSTMMQCCAVRPFLRLHVLYLSKSIVRNTKRKTPNGTKAARRDTTTTKKSEHAWIPNGDVRCKRSWYIVRVNTCCHP